MALGTQCCKQETHGESETISEICRGANKAIEIQKMQLMCTARFPKMLADGSKTATTKIAPATSQTTAPQEMRLTNIQIPMLFGCLWQDSKA